MFLRILTAAAVMTGVLAFARPAAADPNANLRVRPADTEFMCPDSTACFYVTSDKNITHIFVDVDSKKCSDPYFQVFVDGQLVTKLHRRGGPCNHGSSDIDRDVWFPLTGYQKHAYVCVFVPGAVPGEVTVGAKSSDECVDASSYAPYCSDCGSNKCPPSHPKPY